MKTSSNTDRSCKLTAFAKALESTVNNTDRGWWWLRSPGRDQSCAACVCQDGSLGNIGSDREYFDGIRPAFWIDVDQVIGDIPAQKAASLPDETATSDKMERTESRFASELKVGTILAFGEYEQDNNRFNGKEEIEWIVLAKEGDQCLLISRYALDSKRYNDQSDGEWETSSLRAWLNKEFLKEAFSQKEKKAIIISEIKNENDQALTCGSGNNTMDQVFLLSYQEINAYFQSKDSIPLK